MSLLCAMLVVALHVFPSNDANFIVRFIDKYFAYGLGRIAVPYFFMLSGYFIGRHATEQGWWRTCVRKRIQSLFVPYIIWNIAFTLLVLSSIILANHSSGRSVFSGFDRINWFRIVGMDPYCQPINGVTWYIRALFMYLAISPLFVFLLRKSSCIVLGLIGILYLLYFDPVSTLRTARFFSACFSLEGFFYYVMGLFVAVNHPRIQIVNRSSAIVAALLLFGGGMTLLRMYFWCHQDIIIFNCARVVVIPLWLTGIWMLMPYKELPGWMCNASFAIFVMHPFVIYVYKNIMKGAVDSLGGYLGCVVVSVALPMWIASWLRTHMIRIAGIVLGGR